MTLTPTQKKCKAKAAKRYPKALWAELRTAYTSGKLSLDATLDSMESHFVNTYGGLPRLVSVYDRSEREGWTALRRGFVAKVEKTSREKLLDYAAKIGFEAHVESLDTLKDMIKAKKVDAAASEATPDYQARDKAINHLAKMFELYGAEKHHYSGDAVTEIVVNWQSGSPNKGESDG